MPKKMTEAMREWRDENMEAIHEGVRAVKEGRTMPADTFFEWMRAKYVRDIWDARIARLQERVKETHERGVWLWSQLQNTATAIIRLTIDGIHSLERERDGYKALATDHAAWMKYLTEAEREVLPRALYDSRYLSAGSNNQLMRDDIPRLLRSLAASRETLEEAQRMLAIVERWTKGEGSKAELYRILKEGN